MIFLQAAMGFAFFIIAIIIFIPIFWATLWVVLYFIFKYFNKNIKIKKEILKLKSLKYATIITLILSSFIFIYLYNIFTSDDFLKYS